MGLLPGQGREGLGPGRDRRRLGRRREGAAPGTTEKTARYAEEQDAIADRAKEKERERDAREGEAERLMHQHHRNAAAVAFFQVSIALGAVAALTRSRPVWLASLLLGAGGLASLVRALLV